MVINELVEGLSKITTTAERITSDILLLDFTIVNACVVGSLNSKGAKWVLVDTGLSNSGEFIIESVERSFGKDCPPKAIILTHGHFDHVGSVIKLAEKWDVPVYAHALELPYITGKKDYPAPDSTVDGGLVAEMSPSFPHTSINLGSRAKALPSDGSIPEMPSWRWIPTPGHTPGHVSLFRDEDRTLIVGDAFTTVKQESLLSVITQAEDVSGPPAYLTTDWEQSKTSVERLRDLNPNLAIPSHGLPLKGEELSRRLEELVNNFDSIAIPEHGRFVDE